MEPMAVTADIHNARRLGGKNLVHNQVGEQEVPEDVDTRHVNP